MSRSYLAWLDPIHQTQISTDFRHSKVHSFGDSRGLANVWNRRTCRPKKSRRTAQSQTCFEQALKAGRGWKRECRYWLNHFEEGAKRCQTSLRADSVPLQLFLLGSGTSSAQRIMYLSKKQRGGKSRAWALFRLSTRLRADGQKLESTICITIVIHAYFKNSLIYS